jgi:hypothetical protein
MIKSVPSAAKKNVVTLKNPTKNGPTQKSNGSPPISVPPLTRYFFRNRAWPWRFYPRSW